MTYLAPTFSLACLLLLASPAHATSAGPALLVQTTSGPVQGYLDSTVPGLTSPLKKWLGVPYTADPGGANRWQPPQPFTPRAHAVIDATAYGPACMQGRADGGNRTAVQSEDCLVMNIIAPADAEGLPVYLYIYGGGFDSGSSSDPKIGGSYLAARGIVFASFNYRLSLWAWPHSSEISGTQNLGLLDTRAAVVWLKANAGAFGGDGARIVLGGESVGSEMTNLYMSAWPTDPLIIGAVMQSGDTAQPMWQIDSQLDLISAPLGCPTSSNGQVHGQLDCLRTKSVEELQNVLLETGAQFQPVTDNVTIFKDYVKQTQEGHTARIPLLVGTNKDEGTLIVEGEPTAYLPNITAFSKSNNLNFPFANLTILNELYPVPSSAYPTAYNSSSGIWRDAHMLCLASNLARWRTTSLALNVWRYRFDLVANNLNSLGAKIGAFHGEDIRFVMGTWRTIVLSQPFVPATPFEIAVSDIMVEAWTNFIKNPTLGPRIPGWNRYNPTDTTSLAILGIISTGAQPGNHQEIDSVCEYWNTILPIYPQTFPACGNWTC